MKQLVSKLKHPEVQPQFIYTLKVTTTNNTDLYYINRFKSNFSILTNVFEQTVKKATINTTTTNTMCMYSVCELN